MSAFTIDFAGINAALLSRAPELLAEWLPGGRLVGHEYETSSIRGGSGSSFKVNVLTGVSKEFAGGPGYGDLVSLYAAIRGMKNGDAAKELERQMGITPMPARAPAKAVAMALAPAGAPLPTFRHHEHGPATAHWTYHAADGQVLGFISRHDPAEGRKQFFPWTWTTSGWERRSWPAPRPLYGLRELAARPRHPVLVVEGEKACDAARHLVGADLVVVTWPGGVNGVTHADFAPLAGRIVTLWPDHDEVGVAAMTKAADILKVKGCNVAVIEIPAEHFEGWDAADAVEEGMTPAEAMALLATAPREPVPMLAIRTHADRVRDRFAPRPELVQGILPADGLGSLVSLPGVGKSLTAVELVRCVVTGQEFQRRAVIKGRALVICPDSPASNERRLLAIPSPACDQVLTVADFPPLPGSLPLLRATLEQLRDDPVRLVVVDTFDAAREHSGEGWAGQDGLIESIVGGLRSVATDFNVCVVINHHTTRSEDGRARGSLVFDARCDFIGLVSAKNGIITLEGKKNRDGEIGIIGAWQIQPVPVNGRTVPTLVEVEREEVAVEREVNRDQDVLAAIQRAPGVTKSRLATITGIPLGSLPRIIAKLRLDGFLRGDCMELTKAGMDAAKYDPFDSENGSKNGGVRGGSQSGSRHPHDPASDPVYQTDPTAIHTESKLSRRA